jgi:protease-4
VASDAVYREVVRAREAGKPVVVSMTNAAASGGYFVSMAADRIVAQPTTLTGSIGVLGGKFVLEGLLDRLGITYESIQSGENAAFYSFNEPYDEAEWARLQAWLDRVYADFTAKAAEGRDIPLERIQEIARGRVWTGAEALELGLVDDLGGFTTALVHARELAGLDADQEIRLRRFPTAPSMLDLLLRKAGGEASDGRVGMPPATTGVDELGRMAVAASTTDQLLGELLPLVRAIRQAGIWREDPAPLTAPLPRVR